LINYWLAEAVKNTPNCSATCNRLFLQVTRLPLDRDDARSCLPVPKTKTDKQLTFEDALAELESIVETMEDGQLPLEKSLSAYKRGAELLQFCQRQLQDAQQQVNVLEAETLQKFAGDDGDE
jgi:exodeoxyribonuclease VII small subunit